jgi:hypothetical protein
LCKTPNQDLGRVFVTVRFAPKTDVRDSSTSNPKLTFHRSLPVVTEPQILTLEVVHRLHTRTMAPADPNAETVALRLLLQPCWLTECAFQKLSNQFRDLLGPVIKRKVAAIENVDLRLRQIPPISGGLRNLE